MAVFFVSVPGFIPKNVNCVNAASIKFNLAHVKFLRRKPKFY